MKSPGALRRAVAAEARGKAISAGTLYSSPTLLSVECALGRVPRPHRLPIRTLDLLPALLDQFDDALWHRHVVQLLRHVSPIVKRPREEVERLASDIGLGLLPVHQDEAGSGDRPTVLTRLVGQQQIEILRLRPISIGRSCLKRSDLGVHELPV